MKRPIILILCSHMLIFPMYVFTQSEDNTQNPAINETKPEERPVAEDKKTEPTSIEEKSPEDTTEKKMPKGFSKGKISLEFKGGQGTNSSLNSAIGKTRSEIDELLFEYGISNSIGIGFTIHHQKYIHKSETLETNKNNSIIENLYAISLLSSSHNSLYNYILLSSLNNAINQKNTLIFHSTSLDLSGSYHFLTGNTFDPFVRGYLGLGTLGGDGFGGPISYIHLGFGGGIRYYFTSMWFAIAEINTNIYNIVDGGFHEFNEANGQIGVGLSF